MRPGHASAGGGEKPARSHPALLLPDNPGEDFLSPEDWQHVAAAVGLSRRELQAATLLLAGVTRRGLARRLGCAPGTARVYIDRLFHKLNVRDRVGLVLRIVRIHLILWPSRRGRRPSHKNATGEAPAGP